MKIVVKNPTLVVNYEERPLSSSEIAFLEKVIRLRVPLQLMASCVGKIEGDYLFEIVARLHQILESRGKWGTARQQHIRQEVLKAISQLNLTIGPDQTEKIVLTLGQIRL